MEGNIGGWHQERSISKEVVAWGWESESRSMRMVVLGRWHRDGNVLMVAELLLNQFDPLKIF